MSGLEEAIEAGVIPYLGHEPYDPEVRDSVKADVRAILLAAAPALLRAVVAEMNRPMQPAKTDCVVVGTHLRIDRVALLAELDAALSRLGRAEPKEDDK